jgi:hypothetical protein
LNAIELVDHLVYATPNLIAGVEVIAHRLGVRPAAGGRHPAWGTRNALLSLGAESYLEIIGPDPEAAAPSDTPRPFGIDHLPAGRLITWAAKCADLAAAVLQARGLGLDLGDVQSGARSRPDGVLLSWALTDVFRQRADGIVPFLIDWGRTPHPAATAPRAGRLLHLRAVHPDAAQVKALLAALSLDIPVRRGSAPALVATIETSRGAIELT